MPGIYLRPLRTNAKFQRTGDSQYIYQNNIDKACFQHEISYRDFKNLPK